MQCTYCDRWVHPKCANITKAHLELYKLPSCQYICDTCVKVSSKIKKEIHHLQVKQMEMREDIDSNKQELVAQNRRLEKVEKKVKDLDPAKIIEQSRDGMLKELRERDSRKDNLVFYNVEEPEMPRGNERKEFDIRRIIEICEFMKCPMTAEGIKFIFRVGEKKDDRPGPRPIIICLRDPGARRYILESTRMLASTQFERLSISPDLTPLQRKEEEGMRKEAETRNQSMTDEERLSHEWVLVGIKGQRSLIKRRRQLREGGTTSRGREADRARRGGTGGRRQALSESQPVRETARQLAVAEGARERERVRKEALERQQQKNMETEREKEPEKELEPEKEKETEKGQDTEDHEEEDLIPVEDPTEPRGTMDMEEDDEDEEDEDEDQQDTTGPSQTRDRRKRGRGDTSLSPPQPNQKKKT